MDREGWVGRNSSANVSPKLGIYEEEGRVTPWSHSDGRFLVNVGKWKSWENVIKGGSRGFAFIKKKKDSSLVFSDDLTCVTRIIPFEIKSNAPRVPFDSIFTAPTVTRRHPSE